MNESLRSFAEFVALAETRRRLFILSVFLLFFASLFEGVSIMMVIPFLEIMIQKGNYASLLRMPVLKDVLPYLPEIRFRTVFIFLVSGIVAATCLKCVIYYVSHLIMSGTTRDAEHSIRTKILKRYLGLTKSFFDRHKVGHLSDLATEQVSASCEIYTHLHNMIRYGVTALLYVGLLFAMAWKLTLISFLIAPFLYFLVRRVSQRIIASSDYKVGIDQEISGFLNETLTHYTLVKNAASEDYEQRRFEALSDASRRTSFSISKKLHFVPQCQEIIMTFGIAALVALCSFFFVKESTEGVAIFLSFFIVLKRFSSSLTAVNSSFVYLIRELAPIKKILLLFREDDKERMENGSIVFSSLRTGIRFAGVSFSYPNRPVLSDINLDIQKGKMTALVGHTGAGKTTLVNLIPRFYDVTSGRILVDGTDLREFDYVSLRKKIAVVEQSPAILHLSIRENILYGIGGVPPGEFQAILGMTQLDRLIAKLPDGDRTIVGDRGVKLSGGEKQRVALARAILKRPEIYIFDEATSSLDVETEKLIQQAIDEILKSKTVIAIAHRLVTIQKADHIVVLEAGRIMEQGTLRELLERHGRFSHYWKLQVSGDDRL